MGVGGAGRRGAGRDEAEPPPPGAIDRRAFLATGAGAVVAGLVVAHAPMAFAATRSKTVAPLTRAQFLPYVGKTYKVAGSATKLTLVEVDDLVAAPAGAAGQFSLLFEGAGPSLDSAIHTLKGQGPTVSLFVSPVDRIAANQYYQAVVNRPS